MNRCTIVGRVSKAEGRSVGADSYLLKFSMAADRRTKVNGQWSKVPEWFDCVLWGSRGRALEPHITKGTQLTVIAERETREHEGERYYDYRVIEVVLQGGGNGGGGGQQRRPMQPSASNQEPTQWSDPQDEGDLPF